MTKLLYISNSRFPTEKAYGVQIAEMCQAFSEIDCDIQLILPDRKNQNFNKIDAFSYYQVQRKFDIKYLKIFDPIFLMPLPFGIYTKLEALLFIRKLLKHSKEYRNLEQYIIYTRDEYLLPILQKLSAKVVWEAHTLPANKKYYLRYWKNCYKIITISQGLKNELVKEEVKNSKILVAPDGVDLKKFQIEIESKESMGLSVTQKTIMYTGHLYGWKGVQVLAEAAELLSSEYQTVFIGGTDTDIKNFKQKNKDKNNIKILGHKPYQEIPKYLKLADILVLPNSATDRKSKKWTSPLKMFEYMAAGKPIIAASLPSIKEILDESNAVFFEADNPKDLADKIKLVASDEELANKISLKALKDAQHHTWASRAQKIIKFVT